MHKFLLKNDFFAKPGSIVQLGNARWFLLLWMVLFLTGGVGLLVEEERAVFRWVNGYHSEWADHLFPIITLLGTAGAMGVLFILLLLCCRRFRNKEVIVTGIVANVVPFIIVQVLKNMISAPRPLRYFQDADWIHTVPGVRMNLHHSFPSGHSEGAFAFFVFLSCLLPAGKRWIGILCFLFALLTAYSRMYLAQHFYADVYVGGIIGAGGSLLAVLGMNRFWERRAQKKASSK